MEKYTDDPADGLFLQVWEKSLIIGLTDESEASGQEIIKGEDTWI